MTVEAHSKLVIHQTLHGYSDGHRLLVASRKLPREADRTMIVLSDLSGQGRQEGFESYLTAYPLAQAGCIALARTWYAPEMPRPGSVWTHSLLIAEEDLGRLEDLSILLSLFRRPLSTKELDTYSAPAELDPLSIQPLRKAVSHDCSPIGSVLEGLYDKPDVSVIIPVEQSADVELLFLDIWSQQWPSLRCSFSFCTGSISNRTLNSAPFDLQAAPIQGARRLAKNNKRAFFVEGKVASDADSARKRWTDLAVSDLQTGGFSGLRAFLRQVGRSLPGERIYFKPLVEACDLTLHCDGADRLDRLIHLVSETFPQPEVGTRLKNVSFGPESSRQNTPFDQFDELDLLRGLAREPKAFDPEDLWVRSRVANLWPGRRDELKQLADIDYSGLLPPIRESILLGLADALSSRDFQSLLVEKPGLAERALVRRPHLALDPEVWRCSSDLGRSLLDLVTKHSTMFHPLIQNLTDALVEGQADQLAGRLYEGFGTLVIDALLRRVERGLILRPTAPGWRGLLRSHQLDVLAWIDHCDGESVKTLAFIATNLDPNDPIVLERGILPWLPLTLESEKIPPEDRQAVLGFLLSLGLLLQSNESFAAVAVSFDEIYQGAARDALEPQVWHTVSRVVPSSHWWSDWDRCERLRLAAAHLFLSGAWSGSLLFNLTQDNQTLWEVVRTIRWCRSGKHFLRRLLHELDLGRFTTSEEKAAVLRHYI